MQLLPLNRPNRVYCIFYRSKVVLVASKRLLSCGFKVKLSVDKFCLRSCVLKGDYAFDVTLLSVFFCGKKLNEPGVNRIEVG